MSDSWEYRGFGEVFDGEGVRVADVYRQGSETLEDHPEVDRRGKLIAAANDLLAACEGALEILPSAAWPGDSEWHDDERIANKVVSELGAAIAKARGV